MQSNKDISQEFLNSIKVIDNIPCFVKINDSKFIVIAIHQHLGLVQNFTQIVSKLVQNYASIIIPDFFCNIDIENIDDEDQFACMKMVEMNDIYLILKKCISYAQSKNKIIILLGFSIGAALGLKLIQNFEEVSFGMFFYGYPITKNVNPQIINCPVVIFHAQNDKIKYLSDNQKFNSIIKAYQNQPNIQIQQINSSHGFMNHQHPNYDQKSFKYCRKLFHQYLLEVQKEQETPNKKNDTKKSDKKPQESECSAY